MCASGTHAGADGQLRIDGQLLDSVVSGVRNVEVAFGIQCDTTRAIKLAGFVTGKEFGTELPGVPPLLQDCLLYTSPSPRDS